MKKLLETWQYYLKEEAQHYEMLVSVKAQPDTQIYGSIFDKIRAIDGITIVKSTHSIGKDTAGNKIVNLSLKFLMEPGLGDEYVDYVKRKMDLMKDKEGDRILGVRVTQLPQALK